MEKIDKLKKNFKENNIEGYIVPKNDEFFGEYISENKDRLKYISNFSGSYGFALILNNKNYLFIDGRYTLQAKIQSGNNFLIKTLPKELPKAVLKNKTLRIGFDPQLFTKKILNILFSKTNCKFIPVNQNLVDKIWLRKANYKTKKFYTLPSNSVGQVYKQKIDKIVSEMKKKGADLQFITASENSAWLLNIRGEDSKYTPIPHVYILIDQKKNISFFCDLKKISHSFKKKFNKVSFINIKLTGKFLSKKTGKKFIIDKNTCSLYFEKIILKNNILLNQEDPIYVLKSIKTKNEIENIKKANIFDGSALTKYLF